MPELGCLWRRTKPGTRLATRLDRNDHEHLISPPRIGAAKMRTVPVETRSRVCRLRMRGAVPDQPRDRDGHGARRLRRRDRRSARHFDRQSRPASGSPRTATQAGVYRFDAVDLGVYELKVAHAGISDVSRQRNRRGGESRDHDGSAAGSGRRRTRIEVSAESSEMLIKDSPLRGGNFQPREVRDLPLVSLNPLSLARTLPGVTDAAGSTGLDADCRTMAAGSPSTASGRAGITTCWTERRTTMSG